MTTTSLKLTEELKQRAISIVQKQGVTHHAFMVDAIEKAASAAEKRASFLAEVREEKAKMLETGKGYDAAEVHEYLKARVTSVKISQPKMRSWRIL